MAVCLVCVFGVEWSVNWWNRKMGGTLNWEGRVRNICIDPTIQHEHDETQGQFSKWSFVGLNSSFSSPRLVSISSLKTPTLANYLPIAVGVRRIDGFIPSVLTLCEMQTASSMLQVKGKCLTKRHKDDTDASREQGLSTRDMTIMLKGFIHVSVRKRSSSYDTGHHHHHHHRVVPIARISLTLSRHFSQLFIASGRSSGPHTVS